MLNNSLDLIKNSILEKICLSIDNNNEIEKSMLYSARAESKMLRGLLVHASGKQNLKIHESSLTCLSAAIELVHTYSLIHDDLPSMDNDDMRRNQPAAHIKFGEANAILSGDALQSLAFEIICNDQEMNYLTKIECIKKLCNSCGKNGMVYGQFLDINSVDCATQDGLDKMYYHKTGMLIECSIMIPHTNSSLDNHSLEKLNSFSKKIGLAFQIKDDILDITSTSEIIGKNIGSDSKNSKMTYPELLGIDESQKHAENLIASALDDINIEAFKDASLLKKLAKYCIDREI